jgi:hypothetical protein
MPIFDAPDAHFDKFCIFSGAKAKKLEIRNIVNFVKEPKNPKQSAIELSHIVEG